MDENNIKSLIRCYAQQRGIEQLLHFTRLENLPSIIQHGLLPRSYIRNYNIRCNFNDNKRLDGLEDAICLSISFPNYRLFYKFRKQYTSSAWIILEIDPTLLWEYECIFCIHNAASSLVSRKSTEERKTFEEFKKIFEDLPDINIKRENLPDSYPTSPQAEVLVTQRIPLSLIRQIYTNNKTIMDYLQRCRYPIPCSLNYQFFGPRCDWQKFWNVITNPLTNPRELNYIVKIFGL